jgi:hypothetical protein
MIDKFGNIVLDVAGNFVLMSGIEQVAQDCWLAIQTHIKDIWYNQQYGMPYFDEILGFNPPESLLTHNIQKTLGGVVGVDKVFVSGVSLDTARVLHATITIVSGGSEAVIVL